MVKFSAGDKFVKTNISPSKVVLNNNKNDDDEEVYQKTKRARTHSHTRIGEHKKSIENKTKMIDVFVHLCVSMWLAVSV